jgi:hypothetical protein
VTLPLKKSPSVSDFVRLKKPTIYSNGLVRVPHQVRKRERPTVSKTRATRPTATVSNGLFSVKIWAMNYRIISWFCSETNPWYLNLTDGAEEAKKTSEPR